MNAKSLMPGILMVRFQANCGLVIDATTGNNKCERNAKYLDPQPASQVSYSGTMSPEMLHESETIAPPMGLNLLHECDSAAFYVLIDSFWYLYKKSRLIISLPLASYGELE